MIVGRDPELVSLVKRLQRDLTLLEAFVDPRPSRREFLNAREPGEFPGIHAHPLLHRAAGDAC